MMICKHIRAEEDVRVDHQHGAAVELEAEDRGLTKKTMENKSAAAIKTAKRNNQAVVFDVVVPGRGFGASPESYIKQSNSLHHDKGDEVYEHKARE
jgi:hypothetical protein